MKRVSYEYLSVRSALGPVVQHFASQYVKNRYVLISSRAGKETRGTSFTRTSPDLIKVYIHVHSVHVRRTTKAPTLFLGISIYGMFFVVSSFDSTFSR
jgi:hypothetical protein